MAADDSRDGNAVLWDFHGTLVREEGGWAGALLDVLNRLEPGHRATREAITPHLQEGFPWHAPEQSHPHLSDPQEWWLAVEPIFARAFLNLGFPAPRASSLAKAVRSTYLEINRYELFDDAVSALGLLSDAGWKHVILSNHVPELPQIVAALGLDRFVDAVVTSASTGFEKPHPAAYAAGLAAAGWPALVWMVGDQAEADVLGAEQAGIPAILVRRKDARCRLEAEGLLEVTEIILAETALGGASHRA